MQLRPYQSMNFESIRYEFNAADRVAYVAPTGSGKTILFSFAAKGATDKGRQTLILCHRVELVDQISAALASFGVEHSYIAAGYPYRRFAPVHVASVQTVIRRLEKIIEPSFIIVDECHHVTVHTQWGKIINAFPKAKVLGLTATPRRASGEGLGGVFQRMVIGPSVSELIHAGYLSDFRVYGPPTVHTAGLHIRAGDFIPAEVASVVDKPSVMGDAISHYRKLADGKPAVVFCYSVEHSKATAAAFRAAGYKFEHLDGGFSREIRASVNSDFKNGAIH